MGFGKDGRGAIITSTRSQALAGLASNAVIAIGTKIPIIEDFRILRQEISAHVSGLTAGEGNGSSLIVYDGDLGVTEAAAARDAEGPVGPNDSVVAATAERPVWLLGIFGDDQSSDHTQLVARGRDGSPICMHKPRWTFASSKSWVVGFHNTSGVALTTGATVRIVTKQWGVWVR